MVRVSVPSVAGGLGGAASGPCERFIRERGFGRSRGGLCERSSVTGGLGRGREGSV